MRDFDIDSDLKQEKFQNIKLVQGDRGNKIKINVYEDGQPVSLTGCSVTAKYKRADGEIINDGVIENIHDNSFDAVMDSSITKVAGTLKMLFTIEKDAVKVSAFLLLADVREGIGENTGSSGGSTGGGSGEVTIDLSNYYKKIETYSRKEIDAQFKDIGNKKANKNEIKIIVNVKSFGAKGDGTTNDSPSINNALAYAKANKIMNVYIPEGQYIIDESPIKVHSGITFYGDGSDDPYNCGGTRLYGGNNLNGPIVTNDNTLYHFKWFDMQVRNGKSHGAYLIDLGENSYIDRVAFYDNRGDGLRIGSNGNLTPCHLGHISVHKNDGAGIRFENISSTQIQVLYLSMDNNKDCGMSIDIGDTSSNFQLLAWKSERWKNDQADYQDRQKTIFKIHNLNGGTVHLGQGRVHLGNNMDNSDGGVIHQTCEEGHSVGYVMWDCITKSSNANNLAYAFGYKDDKNNETISFEDILRKTFISGHTIQLAQTRGTLMEIGRADTKFYFGKSTSLPTFNTPYGSLVIIGNKIYLNTNNATKFDRIVNNNFDEDFIIKANKGVVLTSSNYTEYRLKVDNDGNLSTELVND